MSAPERGSVSIVVVALMAMALVLSMGMTDLARVLTRAARAQTAADAAALAAAQELATGSASGVEPADMAAAYAERNGAVLTACSCAAGGTEAVVTVSLPVGPLAFAPDDRVVTARARAVVDIPA
ncbi:MAG: pilus assembly protein TadG-related protein [Actinomycetota bacterium]